MLSEIEIDAIPPLSDQTWEEIRVDLHARFGEEKFDAYLKSIRYEGMWEGVIFVSVPSIFLQSWIANHYQEDILTLCKAAAGETVKIRILKRTVGTPVTIPGLRAKQKAPEEIVPAPLLPQKAPVPAPLAAVETVESVQEASYPRKREERVRIHDIIRAVAAYYGSRKEDIISKWRTRAIARARHVGMYLSHELTHRSLPEIGRIFGNRDHTTVHHSCWRITELMKHDEVLSKEVAHLSRYLQYGDVVLGKKKQ